MTSFTVRELTAADSDNIVQLMLEGGGMMATHFIKPAYDVITQATEHETVGFGIDDPSTGLLVAMATASFGELQYEGRVLPYATLHSWQVHSQHRGKGLGAKVVMGSIEYARERYGDEIVLTSGTSQDNKASIALASKWADTFSHNIVAGVLPVRKSAPRALKGVTVRELEPSEYAGYAEKSNTFYADYNLYEPLSEAYLHKLKNHQPGDKPMFRIFGAFSANGEIIAGVYLRNRSSLVYDLVDNPPIHIKFIAQSLGMIGTDNKINSMSAVGLWFMDGQLNAAKYLWQMMRYLNKDNITMIGIPHDKRSPVAQVVEPKPWHFIAKFSIVSSIKGPVSLDPNRLLFNYGQR